MYIHVRQYTCVGEERFCQWYTNGLHLPSVADVN